MILGAENLGNSLGKLWRIAAVCALALMLTLAVATQGIAQESAQTVPAPATVAVDEPVAANALGESGAVEGATEAGSYTPLGPDMIKGQPVSAEEDFWGSMTFQDQHNADGRYALWMHDAILIPVIFAISIFVLFLLLWVVARYRKGRNPTPSKTTHNTLIEVLWTLIPVIVLVLIAVPSITLLARQYETPPADAVTIKATGYQWYWGYTYPDNGGLEVFSNILSEEEAVAAGLPHQLAVDNRMVVPANTPLRIQVTGADVIHGFGIPSLWFKIDAVPGRLNERLLTIDEPGIYYGQCMELCGPKHGYMPISIEALPRADWENWVRTQGGTVGPQEEEATPAAAAIEAGAPAIPEEDAAQREGEVATETAPAE